ncbi:MAG: non-homologous end-joining DNA ligase [Bacilli bacterium]|nr:non-homologous end-joining DNA ligase [Bacilli bacterium]
MTTKLIKYNQKRNFNKTKEPKGIKASSSTKLHYAIQHHLARKDHYDFRLELDGVLISWAVPKGPSFNPHDKRLAIKVEDHPLNYQNFEGIIPKGEYGGGTVMLWDKGFWIPINNPKQGLKKGTLKFTLKGKRLNGNWTLVRMKDDNWLLIKEKDSYSKNTAYIDHFMTSIKTGLTIREINNDKKSPKKKAINTKCIIENVEITNPDKIIFADSQISKQDIALYYQTIYKKMAPYLENRIISTIRCPDGINGTCFYKKHMENIYHGLKKVKIKSKDGTKEDYYYIKNITGLISEVQMNSVEFHIWGTKAKTLSKPDLMVFDLDPDKKLELNDLRQGVKDLKDILDDLKLVSFLKTSGGKGYHVVVPIKPSTSWKKFQAFAKNIALYMETKWPDCYVANDRKSLRKNKIFIDWMRNIKGSTSVAPYSLRIKKNGTISMPIFWRELYKIAPDEITMQDAIKRLNRKDPWKNFWNLNQELK